LYKHRLPSHAMQGGFFLVSVFDKLTVNMTSCSEVKEKADEEDGRQESSLRETDETVATLEAIPVCLNWGHIYSLPNDTHQHKVATLNT